MTQRFQRGDHVSVAAEVAVWLIVPGQSEPVPEYTRPAIPESIVLGSYADLYGGSREDSNPSYSLLMLNGSSESWFGESSLTLIRHGSEDEIRAILAEREARESHERDIEWIAAHWMEIRECVPTATCEELMRRVGITEPWGSQGEGMAWHANMKQTWLTRIVTPLTDAHGN